MHVADPGRESPLVVRGSRGTIQPPISDRAPTFDSSFCGYSAAPTYSLRPFFVVANRTPKRGPGPDLGRGNGRGPFRLW